MPPLIYTISNNFSKTNFTSLSQRWKVIETIIVSTKNVQLIYNGLTICTSPSIGYYRNIIKVAELNTITIYY